MIICVIIIPLEGSLLSTVGVWQTSGYTSTSVFSFSNHPSFPFQGIHLTGIFSNTTSEHKSLVMQNGLWFSVCLFSITTSDGLKGLAICRSPGLCGRFQTQPRLPRESPWVREGSGSVSTGQTLPALTLCASNKPSGLKGYFKFTVGCIYMRFL